MNVMHVTNGGDIVIFSDDGIVLHYTWESRHIRRYYPYGSIKSIKADTRLLGVVLEIIGKETNADNMFSFYKSDKTELAKSVAFAKSKMETAPNDHMFESDSNDIPKSEEDFISEAVNYHSERSEKERCKSRNLGLIILLLSICAILFACFGPASGTIMGILVSLGILFGIIGLFMFGSNLTHPAEIRIPKSSSGTKEIIKGAIIGSFVAGDVGAVIGATIAKNKLDNKK